MSKNDISIGEAKRRAILSQFQNDNELDLIKGKLDTAHLVLREVKPGIKRWVDPHKGGEEFAKEGKRVFFMHAGQKYEGKIGRVAPNGQYEVVTDDGRKIYKHPHLIETDGSKLGGDSAPDNPAAKISDEALKRAAEDKSADPEIQRQAREELERRSESTFSRYKKKLEIQKNGIDLEESETAKLYNEIKDLSIKELEDIDETENLNAKEKAVLEHVLREKTYTEPNERMDNYEHLLKQTINAPRGNLFIYGKGGIGKSYNARKVLIKKYGKDAEFDPEVDSYKTDSYKYVFPDKVTPAALYELLWAHNGKVIVFDDADGILKDPEVVNMLKKAMDTSDSRVGKQVKGGKPLQLFDPATGTEMEVPSSFKFNGKIIFISNKPKSFFTSDEDKRALLSRGTSQELQFNNHETLDVIKSKILPGIKEKADWKTLGDTLPKDSDGDVKKDTPQYKQFVQDVDHVFKFIEDNIDDIPDSKLNGRIMENLYQSYKYTQDHNREVKAEGRGKMLDTEKYLKDQLLKGEEDELGFPVYAKNEDDLEKAFAALIGEDLLEKAGKATLGEVRHRKDGDWVKHSDGWVHLHAKTGKYSLWQNNEKKEAGKHHIEFHKKTIGGVKDEDAKKNSNVVETTPTKNETNYMDSVHPKDKNNKTKIFKESDLIWKNGENIKVGDVHQFDDGENGDTERNWVTSTVKKVVPYKNGFNEVVGVTITWDDGTSDLYRGDLQFQPKENGVNNKDNVILENIPKDKKISIEEFLKKIGKDSNELSKEKNSILDKKILFEKTDSTNFSGSWGVPNPSTSMDYFLPEGDVDEDDLKNSIRDKKLEEKEHRKRQKREQDGRDYRYQRPSTYYTEYGVTTLRNVLKDFDKRQKSSHGSLSSSNYYYNIKVIPSKS